MANSTTLDRMTQTKETVLEAAIELFGARGFHEIDVQAIADRAGVGKGTVYRHFGDKEKLFLAAAKYAQEQMAKSIGREIRSRERTVDFLRNIAMGCARYYEAHPEAMELIVQERAVFRNSRMPTHRLRYSEGERVVEDVLRHGIERGELRPIDVHATYDAFGDLLFGCIFNGVVSGKPNSIVTRVQHAMELFIEGITGDVESPPGRRSTSARKARGGP
jgi:AcrR family transcriptional regulator